VLSLTQDAVAHFLKRPYGIEMIDTGQFYQQFPVSKAGGADGRPASRYARDLVTLLR
jgi:hypothetical protein